MTGLPTMSWARPAASVRAHTYAERAAAAPANPRGHGVRPLWGPLGSVTHVSLGVFASVCSGRRAAALFSRSVSGSLWDELGRFPLSPRWKGLRRTGVHSSLDVGPFLCREVFHYRFLLVAGLVRPAHLRFSLGAFWVPRNPSVASGSSSLRRAAAPGAPQHFSFLWDGDVPALVSVFSHLSLLFFLSP